MKTLEDFETRLVHDGKRNNREVKVICFYCGNEYWERWQRIKSYLELGKNGFCSLLHYNLFQKETSTSTHLGKENAGFSWDATKGSWLAYWNDPNTGKMRTTTKARWLWENYKGNVPNGYWVNFVDGNPENCRLENLFLISRGERMSKAMMGHRLSDETKQKIGDGNRGRVVPEEELERRSIAFMGEKNPRWIDGRRRREYPRAFYYIRENILERDSYECQACYESLRNRKKAIHHIDENKKNNKESNLISLCQSCHGKVHFFTKTNDKVIERLQNELLKIRGFKF